MFDSNFYQHFEQISVSYMLGELDYKESWALKNWCFCTVVLEKTLESPFDCKEIQPIHPKGNQSWIFIARTDTEAETSILWPPDVKSWLIWKDPDAGKDWSWEEKGTTENEMFGWYHWWHGVWTWVWVNSRSWWWTGRPGVLPFMGSQRVRHDWVTELNGTENGQPGRNWQILRQVPSSMTESGRNRNHEQPNYKHWN